MPTENAAFSKDSNRTVAPNIPLIPVTVPRAKARATTDMPMNKPPTKLSAGENEVRDGSPWPPEKGEAMFYNAGSETVQEQSFQGLFFKRVPSMLTVYGSCRCKRCDSSVEFASRIESPPAAAAERARQGDPDSVLFSHLTDLKQGIPFCSHI
jgi:hypothetical protein